MEKGRKKVKQLSTKRGKEKGEKNWPNKKKSKDHWAPAQITSKKRDQEKGDCL